MARDDTEPSKQGFQVTDRRVVELAPGLEPGTCCLQDRSGSSTACWRVVFLQVTSGGSSNRCAPVGSSNAGWNDWQNDRQQLPGWVRDPWFWCGTDGSCAGLTNDQGMLTGPTGGGYGCHMTVPWSEEIDGVLGGDLTAALTYLTPAGGAVATCVAPVGLRDRQAGWVGFTTSLGFGKKLDRIERDPHVALAFHAREHGGSHSQRYVLVQGRAEIIPNPEQALLTLVYDQAVAVLGPAKRGRLFWDRWLREYYAVRVPVLVQVDRILTWPDLRCEGEPGILGAPASLEPPTPQAPPRVGPHPAWTAPGRPAAAGPSGTSSWPTGAPMAIR
jgi:Pyridoxamine 5'-phosphate oxidase